VSKLFLGFWILLFLFFPLKASSSHTHSNKALPIPEIKKRLESYFSGLDSISDSCVGSSGDPIVKITFGTGPNYGPPLSAGITNLTYTNMGCPADGFYTLANMSTDCFSGDWQVTRDHTGDPGGYFMLINASYTPNDFFVQRVDSLCSGTTFEFSSWVINMNNLSHGNAILPNITFTIEDLSGKVLQKYNSGNISQTYNPTWVKYGFYFTTPPGVNSVVLRLTNNAPGGNGNDLGLDDISFRPVGPSITGSIGSLGQTYPTDSLTICLGKPGTPSVLNFSASIQKCFKSPDFQWQKSMDLGKSWTDIPNAITKNYNFPIQDTGLFYFRLAAAQSGNISNKNCRFVSQNIKIGVYNIPNPSIQINSTAKIFCEGDLIQISALSHDAGSSPQYQWFVNGKKAGTNSPAFSSNSLLGKDSIFCLLTSSLPCSEPVVSNIIGFEVSPYPKVQLNSEFYVKNGKSLYLNPFYQGTISNYLWTPSDGLSDPSQANPLFSPVNTTTYTLKINNSSGCSDTVHTTIYVIYDLDIPNIFSPNNDGINDTWVINHLTDFKNNTVDIFNRYGQSVFHSLGYGTPWDGKLNGLPLPIGTYYYVINPHFGSKIFSGSVTLIR